MDTSSTSIEGVSRKLSLEELSKEELLKKYRSLMTIAQKAKQARDELAAENASLKKSPMEEVIQTLTEQKLELVTRVDELTSYNSIIGKQNTALSRSLEVAETRIGQLDTEYQGCKRQVVRLTEENEQLLTHLDELEAQIAELNRIGLEQQQQLLILEENNVRLTSNGESAHDAEQLSQIAELQKMLAVSLDEVTKLKESTSGLQTLLTTKEAVIVTLNDTIAKNELDQSELKACQEQLQQQEEETVRQTALDDLNTELHKNRALVEKLTQDINNKCKQLDCNQIESSGINAELQNANEKQRERLKFYHSKIVKLAGDMRKLKESKEYILDSFKTYNQQVNEWKEQLSNVSVKICEELHKNKEEKCLLQQRLTHSEEKLEYLQNANSELSTKLEESLSQELTSRTANEESLRKLIQLEEQNNSLLTTIEMLKSTTSDSEQKECEFKEKLHNLQTLLNSKETEYHILCNEWQQKKEEMEEVLAKLSETEKSQADLEQSLKLKIEDIKYYKLQEQQFSTDKISWTAKQSELETNLQRTEEQLNLLKKENPELKQQIEELSMEKSAWEEIKIAMKRELKDLQSQYNLYQAREMELKQLNDRFANEEQSWMLAQAQYESTIEQNTRLVDELKKAIEKLEKDAENVSNAEPKASQSLQDEIGKLQTNTETERPEDMAALRRENAELLEEMNVMNLALKERGEKIGQQQTQCDELLKQIEVYERQLAQNQVTAQQLQEEEAVMRHQVNADDFDALSTSTISRCDESNRLKEVEESWEERYGKLRNCALKLKAKTKDLQNELVKVDGEKTELQTRIAANARTIQQMQGQLDELQDKVDATKTDKLRLEQFNKDNQKLLMEVANRDESIKKFKQQIESLVQEKSSVDAWKKQVGTKVQALRKENEANTVMRKEFEARIVKLQTDAEMRSKELDKEREKHLSTRSQLQETQNECKKQSVLNLEMQDYERSIKDVSTKLERKNEQITKLKNQIDSQKSSVNVTKEENRLLQDKANELEIELDACRTENRTFKKQIADLQAAIGDKESKYEQVREVLENTRSENEDLSTQLSKIAADHQKANNLLREEKDHFRNESVDLEQRVRTLEDQVKLRNDDLANVTNEYQSYKVRAQSVLRQNQSRDVGVEEKLAEEAASLRVQNQISNGLIQDLRLKLDNLQTQNGKLTEEKLQHESAHDVLQTELDKALVEIEKLNTKHQDALQENSETVRSLKLHAETLSQCYRQQISEQEVRHNREIIELQSKYDKNSSYLQPEIPTLLIPSTIREEGEGSESVDSTNGNVIHPLEKLLGADQDQELNAVKKQLSENETRVGHLTALLADTEQDLAKHMQMNKVLKEEIRRQQRSVERERHAENLEYMKNVLFKFLTLHNGDERMRLVPVLNTILKLSPEETNKLNNVAKGGEKSWSNYLPIWSSASSSSSGNSSRP